MATKTSQHHDETGSVNNWQKGRSLTGSLLYSLKEHIMCDVTFVVGETRKRIAAHRLILSVRSCVFLTMLTGLMSNQDDVVITDIDADIFEQLLKFFYTDDVTIDGNNVIGLLYASNKYDVDILEKKCLAYLETSMTSQDACHVMEQAHFYDKPTLKNKALEYICENGEESLKSAGFSNLCHDCFVKIIESDELGAKEETVVQAAVAWSDAECRRQGRELTPENRRSVLGDAVVEIRYPLLDQTYFDEKVLPTVAFSDSEQLKILRYFLFPKKGVSPFTSNCRANTFQKTLTVINRFIGNKVDLVIRSGNVDEAIMLCLNQNATLQGVQLYGGYGSYDIKASICDVTTDELIVGSSLSKTIVAEATLCDVDFPSPVNLIKNTNYNLIIRIKGHPTVQGINGLSVVHSGSFTCSFNLYKKCKHTSCHGNNTSVEGGQIPVLKFLL